MEILFDGATVQWDHDPKTHSNPKDGSDTDSEGVGGSKSVPLLLEKRTKDDGKEGEQGE